MARLEKICHTRQMTPEEIAEEEKRQRQAELNRIKQMADNKKKEERELRLYGTRIEEPNEEILNFQYKAPVQPKQPKSMTVSVIGIPNAGKSTLINRLVGSKISAESTKSHTTRKNVLGVSTLGNTQICYVDTPGIVTTTNKVTAQRFTTVAWDTLEEADAVLWVMDIVKSMDGNVRWIMEGLKKIKRGTLPLTETTKIILALNKHDLYEKIPEEERKSPLRRLEYFFPEAGEVFDKIFFVSGLNGYGVAQLENYLIEIAPQQEWTFSSDTKSNMSTVKLVEEIVREKVFQKVNSEVTYKILPQTIGWTYKVDGILRIDMHLYLSKKSHFLILVGRKGDKITSIATEARREIQTILNCAVELILIPIYNPKKFNALLEEQEEELDEE